MDGRSVSNKRKSTPISFFSDLRPRLMEASSRPLMELFDRPQDTEVEFTVDESGRGETLYWFLVDDAQGARWYCVHFRAWSSMKFDVVVYREEDPKPLMFRKRTPGAPRTKELLGRMRLNLPDEMSTSVSVKVWSTAVRCIMDFLRKVRPRSVMFEAITESHLSLYERMFERMRGELNSIGYVIGHKYNFFVIRLMFDVDD